MAVGYFLTSLLSFEDDLDLDLDRADPLRPLKSTSFFLFETKE